MFRVHAVNAAGVGMASMASDPVTAKAVEGNTYSQTVEHCQIQCIKFLIDASPSFSLHLNVAQH